MGTILRILLPRLKTAALSTCTRLFSSSTAMIRRQCTNLVDDLDISDNESLVYKRALKLQRPSTIEYQYQNNLQLQNSVSLIGVIDLPFKVINTTGADFGVHTYLTVKPRTYSYPYLRVMLQFWKEIAEISVQHFKPNDFVYVSGLLRSYMKVTEDGNLMCHQQVDVKEINFIAEDGLSPSFQKVIKLEPRASAEEIKQMKRNRLHLWQIFFSNPYEWWDNRNNKTKPNAPDFKHKDTGEILYVKENDPPWIKQQLELLDSGLGRDSPRLQKISQYLSSFDYDEI